MNSEMFKALLVGVASSAIANPALAQSASPSASTDMATAHGAGREEATATSRGNVQQPPQDLGAVGDIIVTARRKDESLSRTPVTVAVIGSDALAKAQIVSESDLRLAVPGLSIRAGSNSNQLNYSIRGNSQDAFSGTRPGVLPYLNEVQIGGSGTSSAFYDLQSIQVLKGPQGTLFGRSATGGAVLFTTVKPTDEFGGYLSALGGNYSALKFEGAINTPIVSDKVLFRLAGFYSQRDGFQKNLFDNSRVGDYQRYGGRGSLTLDSGAGVRNDLVVDYYHAEGTSTIAVLGGLLPVGAPGTPPFIPLQFLYAGTATPQATATGIATLQALTGAPLAAATAFYNAYFADPRHDNTGLTGVLAAQQARGPYVIDTDGSSAFHVNNVIVTNSTSFDIGSDAKIKNIFGYTHLKNLTAYETDGTPYAISQTGNIGSSTGFFTLTEQLSDELQLLGKAFGGRLDYVAGLYFSDEGQTTKNTLQFFDLFFGPPLQQKNAKTTNRTYAAYGQGTYQLNDSGLAATIGLRYTSEKVRARKIAGDIDLTTNPIAPPGFDYDQSHTYNRLSWNFGLQDQINPNTLLYAVTRRAYKSGGFVATSPAKIGYADTAGNAFRAERVDDVEVGAKYQGRLAGAPVRVNLAAFYQWLNDRQTTAYTLEPSGPAAVTVNVPKEYAYGAELDGSIAATDWLTVGGNIDYIHTRIARDPVAANGVLQIFDQVPDTPKVTGIAFADVRVPASSTIDVLLHGDVYAQTKAFTSPRSQNNQGTIVPGYALANFRIGIENQKAGWSLTANLKNAFNRTYYAGGLPAGEIYQLNLLVPGDRRTFTVEARLKF